MVECNKCEEEKDALEERKRRYKKEVEKTHEKQLTHMKEIQALALYLEESRDKQRT